MAIDLVAEEARALEAIGHTAPAAQQAARPGKGNKAQTHFDAAGPMDTGKEGVGRTPSLDLPPRQLGVTLAAGDEPGRCQRGCMLQSRWFEQKFVIADHRWIARIDVESVVAHGCQARAVGIDEPVLIALRQWRLTAEYRQAAPHPSFRKTPPRL